MFITKQLFAYFFHVKRVKCSAILYSLPKHFNLVLRSSQLVNCLVFWQLCCTIELVSRQFVFVWDFLCPVPLNVVYLICIVDEWIQFVQRSFSLELKQKGTRCFVSSVGKKSYDESFPLGH